MKIITPPVRLIIDIAIVCICIFFVLFKELLPVVRVLQVSPEAEAADWVVLGLGLAHARDMTEGYLEVDLLVYGLEVE